METSKTNQKTSAKRSLRARLQKKTHGVGDGIEKVGRALQRKGLTGVGRAIEKMGNKVEHMGEDGGVTPYFLAWLLGVPGSILLLIFALRGCH
jgi:hypothetical protein